MVGVVQFDCGNDWFVFVQPCQCGSGLIRFLMSSVNGVLFLIDKGLSIL